MRHVTWCCFHVFFPPFQMVMSAAGLANNQAEKHHTRICKISSPIGSMEIVVYS